MCKMEHVKQFSVEFALCFQKTLNVKLVTYYNGKLKKIKWFKLTWFHQSNLLQSYFNITTYILQYAFKSKGQYLGCILILKHL